MTWVLSILSLIFNFGLKFFQNQKPPVEVTEAEKVGAAQQGLSDVEASNAKTQTAAAAANTAASSVDTPTGLSKYESSDPNNRDAN
jgi:hypothetical protein